MEEKNYKNHIESAELAEDFSLEDILDEYRLPMPDRDAEREKLEEFSRRLILDEPESSGGSSTVSSIDEFMEEAVGESVMASDAPYIPEEEEATGEEQVEETPAPISEYELRRLVDSDEREEYASGDIDYELYEDEEYEGEEAPVVRRDKHRRKGGRGKSALSPIVALLALMTHKRSQRAKADARVPEPEEDSDIPEMEPEKAVKLYGAQLLSLKLRSRVALGFGAVLLYITLAFHSFLPLAGAMKGPVGASLTMLVLLLSLMICGLDVMVTGIMSLVRGRASYESLVALSCILSAVDAAVIAYTKTGDFGLPFCGVSALSMCFALLGNYWSCKGLRFGFKIASAKSAVAVSAESGISGKGTAMMKSSRGAAGFIRRSEESDLGEDIYAILSPIIIVAAVVFAALSAFVAGESGSIVHCLSAIIACSAAFSGGVCFAHPFAVTAKKLFDCGAAVSGWVGVRDIGKSRGVVISDGDIFPQGTVAISGIRVLQDLSADKVISYTGSVIAASANGLSAAFTDLLRRNGYSLCRVENFAPHEGGGLTAVVNGENVMVGNAGFMNLMGIRVPQKMSGRNTVFTAISGELAGLFDIDYKPLPAVQDALGVLLRSGCDAVFALRDFNMTPDSLRSKFHVSGEGFRLPSYPERFAISGAEASSESPAAALIAREGMVPVVEVSERGKRLYLCVTVATAVAAVASVLGLVLMFLGCWKGDFYSANAAKSALLMLLSLIPNLIAWFWLQR